MENGKLIEALQKRIKELEAINESHRILNGELRQRINELESRHGSAHRFVIDGIGIKSLR